MKCRVRGRIFSREGRRQSVSQASVLRRKFVAWCGERSAPPVATALLSLCVFLACVLVPTRDARAGLVCASPLRLTVPPAATDCLFILRSAVGASQCYPSCACDPDGSGNVASSDALACLMSSVGRAAVLDCLCTGESPELISATIVASEINSLSATVVVETNVPTAVTVTVSGPEGDWNPPAISVGIAKASVGMSGGL